jgi:hypothetical protein
LKQLWQRMEKQSICFWTVIDVNRQLAEESSGGEIEKFVGALKEVGRSSGRKFLRAVLYEDGREELEFQAKNPWECLVVASDDWEELAHLIEKNTADGRLFDEAVIRKKCTKCFLHQRTAGPGDL